MYRSGCTETVHIMSSQCTEVLHLYVPNGPWHVPKYSFVPKYQSGPPYVLRWSCTELDLPTYIRLAIAISRSAYHRAVKLWKCWWFGHVTGEFFIKVNANKGLSLLVWSCYSDTHMKRLVNSSALQYWKWYSWLAWAAIASPRWRTIGPSVQHDRRTTATIRRTRPSHTLAVARSPLLHD